MSELLIIPALDLRKGKCVRLSQGNPRDETVFSKEPVSMAKLWAGKGAKIIHLVDIDGALTGQLQNLEITKKIVRSVKASVQFGGGIRNLETLKEIFDIGVDQAIIGTAAAIDLPFLEEALKKYKNKILVSLDGRDGYVSIRGWRDTTDTKIITLAKEMEKLGLKRIVFTDIKKDGMLSCPNFKGIKELAQSCDLEILVSGGIARLDHLEHLKALTKYGVVGAIVGKALYTGKIDLTEAIELAKKPLSPRAVRKRKNQRRKK